VSRRLALLILQEVTRYLGRFATGTVRTPGGRPDRRRLEADAPDSFYDAGDVLPLAGGVFDLRGRTLPQGIYYIAIMLLMGFDRGEGGEKLSEGIKG